MTEPLKLHYCPFWNCERDREKRYDYKICNYSAIHETSHNESVFCMNWKCHDSEYRIIGKCEMINDV